MNTLEISGRTQSFSSTNSYITLPKQTYRILSPWYIYALSIAFFIAGFIFLGLGIKEIVKGEKINYHNFIIFVVLVLISCIVSYFFPFYSSITIDMANNAITVKKYSNITHKRIVVTIFPKGTYIALRIFCIISTLLTSSNKTKQ